LNRVVLPAADHAYIKKFEVWRQSVAATRASPVISHTVLPAYTNSLVYFWAKSKLS
jgi:hypothetical protein